ncbi:MAG: translation elongation factor Ts [Pseudomonadales bacterium]|nr:translation elongation factor Ts [Pseudomonadales bacterium]
MAVTAALVKELRERTGLGMMDCKKALVETDGDIETAIENLRKSGQAKAAKKAGRTAAEGAVVVQVDGGYGVMVEINSETDFVARDENFINFTSLVVQRVLEEKITDVEKIMALPAEKGGDVSIETTRQALVQKIGENIQIRRAISLTAPVVGAYIHGGRIGVLTALTGGTEEVARDVAMHVAAANPEVVRPEDVPEALQAKEKEIFAEQARQSGKPEEIVDKMIIGRMKKFLAEVSLVEQAFVKDPDTKVGAFAKKAGGDIQSFVRFEVGDGIEKDEIDFATEVMAQVKS